MTTTTATAKKPEQEIHDDGMDDKNTRISDVTNIAEHEERDLSIEERKRIAGFKLMSNRLFRRYEEELLPLLKRERDSEAECRYHVGVVVVDIQDNHLVYGRSDIRQLADAIECSPSKLYDYARVARAWEYQAFSEMMNRKGKQEYRLSFSHLIEVSSADDKEDRQRWIDLALEKGWSVRDLNHQMHREADQQPEILDPPAEPDDDGSNLNDDDNEIATPATIRQVIVRMRGELQLIPVMIPEWHERVFVLLGENPRQCGQPSRDELEQARGACDELVRAVETLKGQIDDVLSLTRQTEEPSDTADIEEGGESDG